MLVLAFVILSFSPIPLPSSRFFLLYSFYICLYPGLLSFHQWIQTNCNHSLQHKSNFTVSNNMLLELLGREINILLFVQDHNGKDFFWRNSFSVKDMQCTNRRTSKVTFKAFWFMLYSTAENFPLFLCSSMNEHCAATTFIGSVNNLRWNFCHSWTW